MGASSGSLLNTDSYNNNKCVVEEQDSRKVGPTNLTSLGRWTKHPVKLS